MAKSVPQSPRYLILGQILRPHGVRGELKMRVMTDYPNRIGDLDTVMLGEGIEDDDAKSYEVVGMRMNNAAGLLRLQGIKDRDAADRLRQLYVMVRLEDAVPLDDGEFYLFQVIGLNVETGDGLHLGKIKDVLETGANDVYVIDTDDYGDILLPVIDETIIEHDIPNGLVRVNLLDGLLPDDPK